MNSEESLLQFPCEYPLKVIGRQAGDFAHVVREIVNRHVPEVSKSDYQTRPSRNEKYVSITVNFTAQSKRQLDALYQELNDHELVLMTL